MLNGQRLSAHTLFIETTNKLARFWSNGAPTPNAEDRTSPLYRKRQMESRLRSSFDVDIAHESFKDIRALLIRRPNGRSLLVMDRQVDSTYTEATFLYVHLMQHLLARDVDRPPYALVEPRVERCAFTYHQDQLQNLYHARANAHTDKILSMRASSGIDTTLREYLSSFFRDAEPARLDGALEICRLLPAAHLLRSSVATWEARIGPAREGGRGRRLRLLRLQVIRAIYKKARQLGLGPFLHHNLPAEYRVLRDELALSEMMAMVQDASAADGGLSGRHELTPQTEPRPN